MTISNNNLSSNSMKTSIPSKPEFVKLGALFARFDLANRPRMQAQFDLAAFLMAIRDINSDKNILPNTIIKIAVVDSRVDPATSVFRTLDLIKTAFGGTGVDAMIGPGYSVEVVVSAAVAQLFEKVQVSYFATSTELSVKTTYRYFARTCPSDAFQGLAMAQLVAYYKWTNVVTLASTDSYGAAGIKQFQTSAVSMGINILGSINFPAGTIDFKELIQTALGFGGRIFVSNVLLFVYCTFSALCT